MEMVIKNGKTFNTLSIQFHRTISGKMCTHTTKNLDCIWLGTLTGVGE